MQHVDALSRAPVSEAEDTFEHLEQRYGVMQVLTEEDYVLLVQRCDVDLRELIDILQKDKSAWSDRERGLVKRTKGRTVI